MAKAKATPDDEEAEDAAPDGDAEAQDDGTPGKTCFVIGPVGGPQSEPRRRFEGVVDHVIRPALRPLGFKVVDPHRNLDGGSITRRIVERLLTADLVVADLTGLNPNVMYELAVRHAKRLPVIQIMRAPLDLPFDLKDDLTFEYVDDIQGAADLRALIARAARQAMESTEPPDNPVFRAARSVNVEVSVEGEPGDFKDAVLERLEELQAGLAEMRRGAPHPQVSTIERKGDPYYKYIITVQGRIDSQSVKSAIFNLENHGLAWVQSHLSGSFGENFTDVSLVNEGYVNQDYIQRFDNNIVSVMFADS